MGRWVGFTERLGKIFLGERSFSKEVRDVGEGRRVFIIGFVVCVILRGVGGLIILFF